MTTPWIPTVTVTEQRGAVAPPANIDQAAVVLGCTSIGTPGLSPLFNNSTSMIAALGYGDTIDAATYITDPINPSRQPQGPIAIYKTASTTPATYGTVDVTGVLGTGTIGVDATSLPFGTYAQAWLQVGAAFTVGVAGGTVRWTLDGGTNWSGYTPVGTLDYFLVPNSGVKWTFSPGATDLTALNTLINEIKTDLNAHVILTTGTVHTSADSADVVSTANATNTATRIALVNALRTAYEAHRVKGSGVTIHINASGDTVNVIVAAVATDDESALTLALDLKAKLNAHDAGTTWHTIADATNTVTSPAPAAGGFFAADLAKVATTGPKWSTADLDTAATDLARSSYDFSQILIVGPCSAAEAAHVRTLLNALANRGKRVEATIYSRGPNVSEPEVTWGAAVQTDFAAFFDDRIEFKEGMPLLLTDPVTARVYQRTWVPAYFARMLSQARRTWAGSPNDGSLDGVQLYSSAGVLTGHDESGDVFTGMGDAFGQGNRFGCVFRGDTPQTRLGVYTTAPWTAWNPTDDHHIYLAMVRRIVNAAERSAKSVSFADLGGSVFYDTDPQTLVTTLQPDAQEAIHGTLFDALTIDMRDDLENAQDADPVTGIVAVSSVITVAGQLAIVPIGLNLKVGAWIIKIPLTITVQ